MFFFITCDKKREEVTLWHDGAVIRASRFDKV